MRFSRFLTVVIVAASLSRGVPAAATTADQVCVGDPCVVSKGVSLTPGSVLDFGNRLLRITPSGGLFAGDGDSVIITARGVTLEPGAIIRGPLFPTAGASVRIETTEDILVQRNGASRARIDVHGQTRGGVIALVANRNVDLAGDLRVDGTLAEGIGGSVDVDAAGTVTMTGEINASGGLGVDGSGGATSIHAGGALVAATIDASSGSGDGSIELTANGALNSTGVLSVAGNAAGGGGGEVTLDANGDITVGGRIAAQGGAGSLADDGLGGSVDISSDANVRVLERIEAFAGGPAGDSGFVTITAGVDLTIGQAIAVHGPGAQAGGGFIDLVAAGGVLTIDGLLDVHGFSAGSVTGSAGAELRARGEINADGQTGEIDLSTISISGTQVPGPVTVSGNLHARGPAGGLSGTIALQGCDVTVDATGRLGTAGSGAINRLRSSRQMTIAGQVIAGPPGTNRFEFRNDPGLAPIVAAGAVVQPPATLVASASLLPCRAPTPAVCGNGMDRERRELRRRQHDCLRRVLRGVRPGVVRQLDGRVCRGLRRRQRHRRRRLRRQLHGHRVRQRPRDRRRAVRRREHDRRRRLRPELPGRGARGLWQRDDRAGRGLRRRQHERLRRLLASLPRGGLRQQPRRVRRGVRRGQRRQLRRRRLRRRLQDAGGLRRRHRPVPGAVRRRRVQLAAGRRLQPAVPSVRPRQRRLPVRRGQRLPRARAVRRLRVRRGRLRLRAAAHVLRQQRLQRRGDVRRRRVLARHPAPVRGRRPVHGRLLRPPGGLPARAGDGP
jgi:hypothetical protein